MLSCANCGEKYLSPDGAELYDKNVQLYEKNVHLQKENEKLKKRQITKNGFICDCEQNAKYKQALEEIREMLKIADKTKKAEVHFEYMDNALVKANEVLNDRN